MSTSKNTDDKMTASDVRALLSKSGTVEVWKEEIERILLGERDSYFVQGNINIRMYVEKELHPPLNKSRGSVPVSPAFNEALRQIVKEWNPSTLREKEYFACIFELIRVYDPDLGFEKTAEFLNTWEGRIDEIPDFGGYQSNADLILRALSALAKRYSIPRSADSGGYDQYKTYLHILERYLGVPKYSGNAAVRLLTLNAYSLQNDIFRTIIKENRLVLRDLCEYIFSPDKIIHQIANLTWLSEHVFSADSNALHYFGQVLSIFGVEIEYRESYGILTLKDGREVRVGIWDTKKQVSVESFLEFKNFLETVEERWNKSDSASVKKVLKQEKKEYEAEEKAFFAGQKTAKK